MAYGVDSGAVMAASVFITIRILRPKRSGPKVVILSGVCCIKFNQFSSPGLFIIGNSSFNVLLTNTLFWLLLVVFFYSIE